ncbi:hypothetical protein [Nitrosomonas sp. Nm34]|uniref:hypothetical protein n=1 Tax=Nitrosomonas sp. Nm34 TaxID=1881055 RepID=UPI0008E352F1|nr:hypothetical protein [Nitrosomonas sp. Nm34]SFI17406.1 hypothetical protein SAMN05428978_100146 [Nitrosomonas sp. Nm34]
MAKQEKNVVKHPNDTGIGLRDNSSFEIREAMISNAAFYFEAKRACTHGFDLDCKVVAEVEKLKRRVAKL